jgi:cyclopropane fatty-acyl-phospholipid synthase-like methyltransferase
VEVLVVLLTLVETVTNNLSSPKISQRLLSVINALPLKSGMRILEVGCGSGAAARDIVNRFDDIYLLGIDRSAKAIAQACKASPAEMASGRLSFLTSAIETFEAPAAAEKFDIVFAVRVGALDGRHPEKEKAALEKIAASLKKKGRLFIEQDGILKEIFNFRQK